MRNITSATLFLLMAAGAAPVAAFTPSQFLGIDQNADNAISAQEAEAYRTRYFSILDLNGNGSVEFEEYVTANKLRSAVSEKDTPIEVPDSYKQTDTNSDTILSLEEFLAAGSSRFTALDKDKNGSISREEFISPGL